jgi:hypothetical protein
VLAAALGGVQQAMDAAFGGDQQGAVNAIVGVIEQAAITAADFLQVGISVAGGLGRAFAAVRVVFDLVAEEVVTMAKSAVDSIYSILTAASGLPKVGDSFKGAAASAADMSLQLGGMKTSFREQATDAAEAVVGNSAFQRTLDGVSKGVQTVRDAMVHARDAKQQDAEATDTATGALKRHGDENERSAGLTKAAAAEAKKHAEEIKKLRLELTGAGIVKGLSDVNEALSKEGTNLRQLPLDALTKINKVVEAGIDLYRRRGQAAPDALRMESLAIRAALREAQNAQIEFDKLHGPVTFGKTVGVDLGNIPTAKNADGSVMSNGSLLSGRALGKDMTNALLLGTSTLDTTKVAAAAAARMKVALGPGFWKGAFGSPQEFGANMASAVAGAIQGGGNVLDSAGGMVGTELGKGIAKKLSRSLVDDGSGMFSKALGGVLSSALPVVGSLIGPLASALWGHLFGSKGRDAVKDFAQSVTGSTDLNALHTYLQKNLSADEAEQFWKSLSQGVGRNNPAQAKQVIDDVTAALAKHGDQAKQTADDAAAAAEKLSGALSGIMGGDETAALKKGFASAQGEGFTGSEAEFLQQQLKFYDTLEEGDARLKTYFSATTIDAFHLISSGQGDLAKSLTDNLKGIQTEMDGLIHQIADEAPEAEMGAAEEIARQRVEQLQKDKAAAEQQLHDAATNAVKTASEAATEAGQATADAVDLALRSRDFLIKVRAQLDIDGGSGSIPGHAEGAYIRQSHVARVHAGEMIGDQTFFGNAIASALSRMDGGGGAMAIAPLIVDGQKLADIIVRRQPKSVRRYGVTSR